MDYIIPDTQIRLAYIALELEVFTASDDVTPGTVSDVAPGSSGGGCEAGFAGISILALAVILMKRR